MATTTTTAAQVGLTVNPDQHIPQINLDMPDLTGLLKLKYEVLSDKIVELDASKAAEYIDLPVFPGERGVVNQWVQTLFDRVWHGIFNEMLVIIATAVFQGVTYKINGQHTAWVVFYMSEKRRGFKLNVREIRYRVQSIEQLKLLYSTYDQSKSRSDSHLLKVQLVNTPATVGVSTAVVSSCATAFKAWHFTSEKERRRITPDQVAATIQTEFAGLFQTVAKYVQEHHGEKFATRQPIISAMFATFHKLPTKAQEFWDPIVTGLNLPQKTDPRYALRDLLIRAVTSLGGATRVPTAKRVVNIEDLYRIAISCWNKWRREEKVYGALRPTNERIKPI